MDEKMKEILTAIHEGDVEEMTVSYDSEDLIAEVKEDIVELGEDTQVFVWARYIEEYDTAFAVDYDFLDATIRKDDIDEDESLGVTTLGELLTQLEKQNSIMGDD